MELFQENSFESFKEAFRYARSEGMSLGIAKKWATENLGKQH